MVDAETQIPRRSFLQKATAFVLGTGAAVAVGSRGGLTAYAELQNAPAAAKPPEESGVTTAPVSEVPSGSSVEAKSQSDWVSVEAVMGNGVKVKVMTPDGQKEPIVYPEWGPGFSATSHSEGFGYPAKDMEGSRNVPEPGEYQGGANFMSFLEVAENNGQKALFIRQDNGMIESFKPDRGVYVVTTTDGQIHRQDVSKLEGTQYLSGDVIVPFGSYEPQTPEGVARLNVIKGVPNYQNINSITAMYMDGVKGQSIRFGFNKAEAK